MLHIGEDFLFSRIAAKKLLQSLSSKAMEIITLFTQVVIVSYQCYTIMLINLREQYYDNRLK